MKKKPKKTPAQKAAALLGKLGGEARAAKLTPGELTAIGKAGGAASKSQSKAGKAGGAARAKKLSPERRREIALKAVEAREEKRRKAKADERE